jgi:hypothetical protein
VFRSWRSAVGGQRSAGDGIGLGERDWRGGEGVEHQGGAEAVSEKWVNLRKVGDTSWTTLGEPVFGDDWDGITGDIFEVALPSSGSVDLEVMLNTPSGAETSGSLFVDLKVMAKNA